LSVTRLPSGRWRCQIHIPGRGNVSVGTFDTKREAKAAREAARVANQRDRSSEVTVSEFRDRWLTHPLFQRPKESTMRHYAERTKRFAETYGDLPIAAVDDQVVRDWLATANAGSTIPSLCAMFSDAAKPKAGRLIPHNPFAGLGLSQGHGRRHHKPPSQEQMADLVRHAHLLTPPSFAAFLEFACLTAARPGEIDALRWPNVDLEQGEVHIVEQWNTKVSAFTEPKYGPYTLALVDRARDLLVGRMSQAVSDDDFVFLSLRGRHYTISTRTHHWNRVRAAAGLGNMEFYLATRHYFASYALNVLELPPHVIAEQLGHRDGGRLITELYGHPSGAVARARIREAFRETGTVTPLAGKRKRKDTA
jgi:integrase